EDEGRGARAALPAVDRDEVHAPRLRRHAIGELDPEGLLPHGRLDAHGQARGLGDALHEVEELGDVAELAVRRGADAVDALGHAARVRDVGGDLHAREDAAAAGLGALAELDLDGANRAALARFEELLEAEAPGHVARAEIARAELEDELAAVEVMARDAALARVVERAGDVRAAVERL